MKNGSHKYDINRPRHRHIDSNMQNATCLGKVMNVLSNT